MVARAEAGGQVFVDREDLVVVIGLDENVADENAREDRAERKLEVGEIAQRKAFAGCAEKGAGTGFGRDDGGEHCPPRNAAAAEGEILEVILLPAHVEADEDDDEKVEEQDSGVDQQTRIHGGVNSRRDSHEDETHDI